MRILLLFLVVLLSACSWIPGSDVSPRPEDAVIRGVNYIGVTVSGLDKSTRLYQEVGNLNLVDQRQVNNEPLLAALTGRKEVRVSTKMMRSVNAQIRFMEFEHPSDAAINTPRVEVMGPGYAHIAIQSNKEMQSYQRFLKGGGTPVGLNGELTTLNPKSPVQYAYARDSDEIMFEFEHVDFTQLDLPEPPKHNYRIRHIAIATPNYDRAVKFYSTLLEQEKPRRVGLFFGLSGEAFDNVSGYEGTKLKMAFFQVRNIELEIAQYVNPEGQEAKQPRPLDALGHNMIMFDVADMEAAYAKLLEAGGDIVSEPQAMEGSLVMFGRDPDKNLIGFQKVEDNSVFSSQNFDGYGI